MNVLGYPHAFGMYGCSLWMQVASSQVMVLTLTPRILALPLVSTGPFTLALFWQKHAHEQVRAALFTTQAQMHGWMQRCNWRRCGKVVRKSCDYMHYNSSQSRPHFLKYLAPGKLIRSCCK